MEHNVNVFFLHFHFHIDRHITVLFSFYTYLGRSNYFESYSESEKWYDSRRLKLPTPCAVAVKHIQLYNTVMSDDVLILQ
jgi:hypothetical protein